MIAAIVVLYNPSIEEIEHINDYCDKVDETIIMDNSKENHFYEIKKYLKTMDTVEYKHYGKNVGLCVALNEGIMIIKEHGHEWGLLMDADSSFITDIVNVYRKYIRKNMNNNIAILSPVHIFDRKRMEKFSGEREVKWAMTSGCLYNVRKFVEIGGFKEELYVDGLDIDYCYRAREHGFVVIEIADAKLNHHPGETRSVQICGKRLKYGVASPWRYYMQARAIVWLILKYHQMNDVFRYISKWCKVILLFDNKKEYITEMINGSKEGVKLWKNDAKLK